MINDKWDPNLRRIYKSADTVRVLGLLTNSGGRMSARSIAQRLDLTFQVARAAAKRLVGAGLVTSEVRREFEKPDRASQSWLFGGATMCVRRRAYYTVVG